MINSAIHHLSKKTYSERELRDVLEAQYSSLPDLNKALTETLNYLGRHRLVNDARLALDIARHCAHKGNQFIRNVLNQRKISSEQINAVLLAIPDEHSRALEESRKKLNMLIQTNSKNEQINTLARFLSGRQFNHSIITEIIDQLNPTAPSKVHRTNTSSWRKAS